jgi:adenine-specific DNA methylase
MIPTTSESPAELKARGAFYTPSTLTEFMAAWAVRSSDDVVLEPASGDGAFVDAIASRLREVEGDVGSIIGIEREPVEAAKVRRLVPRADIRAVDFFDLAPTDVPPVDAVVGNPPYIRYQGFAGLDREKALARARAQEVSLTGLASSWAHFVVHATAFLKRHGRLALVLPAELLHADYAGPVRELLLRRFSSVTILAFDRMVFNDAIVDAVVLLASNDAQTGLQVVRLPDDRALRTTQIAGEAGSTLMSGRWSGAIDSAANDVYMGALERYQTSRLGDFADVDIGFVSGANKFFVLSTEEANAYGLGAGVLTPAVDRPRDVPGLEVRESERRHLLDLGHVSDLDPATLRYLARGVELGISDRYKARHRSPWYAVPLPRNEPHALLPYMSHLAPRLIVNTPGTRNSNLLHGVTFRGGAPAVRALAVAMCGSVTLLSAEIEGRAYGGGVLKLETKEAERLRVPGFDEQTARALTERFSAVDQLIRTGDVEGAAHEADHVLRVDHDATWTAYQAFRIRRLGRKRQQKT